MQASLIVFTVRRYAGTVYDVIVCLSVCLSQAGIVSEPLNTGWRKQCRTTAQFSVTKDVCEIPLGSAHTGAPNAGGVG